MKTVLLTNIINERLVESISNNSDRDFWSEIQLIRSNYSGISRTADGQTGVANLFATKYRDLYTSMQCDINEMHNVENDVKEIIEKADCIFNLLDVK